MPEEEEEDYSGTELARITIVKYFDHDAGREAIITVSSEGLGLAEALGMLSFSKAVLIHEVLNCGDEDEDEEEG